jgi:hypothetical protein
MARVVEKAPGPFVVGPGLDEAGLDEAGLDEAGLDEPWLSDEPGLSDVELTALALSADVDEPLSPDAVPLDVYASLDGSFLPAWYMPPVMTRRARNWRVPAVWVLIAAFLLIDAFGLCICYGQLVAA